MDERSQASVDPNALRALGAEFSNLASKILEMGLELDQGLARLGETFRDDHYHEFRSAFAASRQKLTAFAEEARSLVPKLNQDADDIAASQAGTTGAVGIMRTDFDPREARRFAETLDQRAQEVRQLDSAVSRSLLELHANSWQDARYSQFERRYEEASRLLQLFAGQAEKYAEYLRRKSAPIERYLERKVLAVVQNGTQADVSPERLADLESSIRRFGARSSDGLAGVRAEFEQRRQVLADQEEEARCEVDRCRRALEEQNDDQRDDVAEAALEEAEARLEGIRRWTREVDERFGWFGREAARFQGLLEDRVPAAACFLQEKVGHLRDYHATGLDQPDVAAGPSPPEATVPAPGNAPPTDRKDDTGGVRLVDYSLPRGFKWVPLSEIDLPKELEGLRSREDFRKVPYEAMREGCLRLKNEVLPRLQLPMTGSANDCFRELDSARGVPYSEGLLRVYEAFFGQHDFVYFVRRTPGGPLDIVNGRHRVKMAVDLGWDAVPAQVKE